jgi:hypothetical protein
MSWRLLFVVLVFALDFWALHRVMDEPVRRRLRWKWALFVVLLPVLGVWLWQRESRRRTELPPPAPAVTDQ